MVHMLTNIQEYVLQVVSTIPLQIIRLKNVFNSVLIILTNMLKTLLIHAYKYVQIQHSLNLKQENALLAVLIIIIKSYHLANVYHSATIMKILMQIQSKVNVLVNALVGIMLIQRLVNVFSFVQVDQCFMRKIPQKYVQLHAPTIHMLKILPENVLPHVPIIHFPL